MAAFDKDKVIKQLAPESVKRIKEWRKEFCKPFGKADAKRLEQISDAVDRLFAQVVRERVLATQETSDRIPVWGEPPSAQQADLLVRDQEKVAASLEDGSSAYRRLKLAMDGWCALWFWPIESAELLPDRATWIAQMELILKGQVTHEPTFEQGNLFADFTPSDQAEPAASGTSRVLAPNREASAERLSRLQVLSDAFRERRSDYFDECGLTDVTDVLADDITLRVSQSISDRFHFHHWELRFAEVFARRKGFDLMLGNPPWVKLEWDEVRTLADLEPTLTIRRVDLGKIAVLREAIIASASELQWFGSEYIATQGTQTFLGDPQNNPLLRGVQVNLYKAFMTMSWRFGTGACAFVHPERIFDDPAGRVLRAALYPRLKAIFRFQNELKLFPEINHTRPYCLGVYDAQIGKKVAFSAIANLFHPSTIDDCFAHDGRGPVPGIKTEDNQWGTKGHLNRIVEIDEAMLSIFAKLIDQKGQAPLEARLPAVHSREVLSVLGKLAEQPKIQERVGNWATTREWHEGDRKRDGVLTEETFWPHSIEELVIQGPHFYVGTPLSRTPNAQCKDQLDYSDLDVASLLPDFLPRSNLVQHPDRPAYVIKKPRWGNGDLFGYYRHGHRQMVSLVGERSLVSCIIPAKASTVGGVFTAAFEDEATLLEVSAMCSALPIDFMIKTLGKSGVGKADFQQIPLVDQFPPAAISRVTLLNCMTIHYADLWSEVFREDWNLDVPCSDDLRLQHRRELTRTWTRACTYASSFERRNALIELDVLITQALGISLDELLAICAIQFPVLRKHENARLYDQHGRIVPTSKTVAGNPAVSLVELAATLKEQSGFDVHAEYHPDGSNTQELRKQNIRLGKKEADVLGVSERCAMADLLAETEVRWSDEDHPEGRPVRLVGLRYTDPGLEPRMERVYPTPWTRCDREADYRQAWAEFEHRLGKKMPEGAPL